MDLANRTVVITGASRGLGAGIAQECWDRGMQLGLCARSASPLAGKLRVVSSQLDIADESACRAFCDQVERQFGHIDLWINNAGILEPVGPLRNVRSADFRRHLDVNVLGVFHGSHAYINHVRRTGKPGVLVNISSGAGRAGYYGWAAYCAGKAAVDRMSECIALEEADIDLRVHAVAPGIIDTDMQEFIRSCSAEDFPLVAKFKQLKRDNAFSTAEHVADRLLRLAFDPDRETHDVLMDLRD